MGDVVSMLENIIQSATMPLEVSCKHKCRKLCGFFLLFVCFSVRLSGPPRDVCPLLKTFKFPIEKPQCPPNKQVPGRVHKGSRAHDSCLDCSL